MLTALQGFEGFTLLVDRGSGTRYFESRDALEASEKAVRGPREETARTAGAGDIQVRIMEVAVDTEV